MSKSNLQVKLGGVMKRNINITKEARERVIKAPLKRRFWYRLTLGKWGELWHKQHYMVNVFHAHMDNRTKYAHSLWDGVPYGQGDSPNFINCRCSTGGRGGNGIISAGAEGSAGGSVL